MVKPGWVSLAPIPGAHAVGECVPRARWARAGGVGAEEAGAERAAAATDFAIAARRPLPPAALCPAVSRSSPQPALHSHARASQALGGANGAAQADGSRRAQTRPGGGGPQRRCGRGGGAHRPGAPRSHASRIGGVTRTLRNLTMVGQAIVCSRETPHTKGEEKSERVRRATKAKKRCVRSLLFDPFTLALAAV